MPLGVFILKLPFNPLEGNVNIPLNVPYSLVVSIETDEDIGEVDLYVETEQSLVDLRAAAEAEAEAEAEAAIEIETEDDAEQES